MVKISDVTDGSKLGSWLENKPREVSIWISARATLRSQPVWWYTILFEPWARQVDLTALPVLRRALIPAVAAVRANDAVKSAACAAAHKNAAGARANGVASENDASFSANAASSAHAANSAAAFDNDNFGNAAANNAFAAADASESAIAIEGTSAVIDFWHAVREDLDLVVDDTFLDAFPLWPDGLGPLARQWSKIKAQVAASADAADWQFWIEWYDAQLAGRTMLRDPVRTWDMLEKIALIDPATWDAGPEAVNPRIREIWELYRLRVEVAALQAEKEAFLASRASQAQRSHNQPPEGLVDDQPELARQITIVWDSLDEARDELEQEAPDKGLLRKIAERLMSALTAIAKFFGKVATAGVLAMSVTVGGKVGSEIADHLIADGRLTQFAKDLLTYASGG